MAPKFGLGAEIQSPTGLLLLVLLLLLLLIIFFDSETGPLPTLPTLFLLFLCLFFGLLLWDFQSTKALSFYNRSSLNFAQRLKTIFSTILHNIGLHISSSSSSIGGPYRPTVPGPSMYCKSARHIYHSAHCTQLGTVPTASLTTVVHKYEKHGSFSDMSFYSFHDSAAGVPKIQSVWDTRLVDKDEKNCGLFNAVNDIANRQ